MPNWTRVYVSSENLSSLDIFREDENGNKNFDFNKIIPEPEYIHKAISPMQPDAVLSYLIQTEKVFKNAKNKFTRVYGFSLSAERRKMKKAELLSELHEEYRLGGGKTISAYELGELYLKMHAETGFWDWYNWRVENWGVKSNASGTDIDYPKNEISFDVPNYYPEPIFEKMQEMFPDENFSVTIYFEDEPETVCHIEFGDGYWREYAVKVSDT